MLVMTLRNYAGNHGVTAYTPEGVVIARFTANRKSQIANREYVTLGLNKHALRWRIRTLNGDYVLGHCKTLKAVKDAIRRSLTPRPAPYYGGLS